MIVTGTLLPDITAFIQAFKQQHYNPRALIATAGPDQGAQFTKAIGGNNAAEGIFVPNGGWYPQINTFQNAQMVQNYLAKYGSWVTVITGVIQDAAINPARIFGPLLVQSIDGSHTHNWIKFLGAYLPADLIGAGIAAFAYDFIATPRRILHTIEEAVTEPDRAEPAVV